MEQEEYIVDGHRVTHCVHLGDKEIFLAVQQDAPLPFYVGYMEVSYELGLARFSGIEGTTEYTEAWELFIQRLQKQIEQVHAQRSEHHAPPQLLTEADCIRDSRAGDYEGKVLVMRPGVLRPEYWNAAHQLYFAVGGNGARASGHGTKVFCINIYTGEHTYIRRTDVMGAIEPDRLPGWAEEKAAALRQDYQREKAAEKRRLEEFLTACREKETSENLRRPRAAQTRGKAFFSTTMDMQERKAFLVDAMGHTYTELFIGNHRYGYCNRGNGTVEFWRGGYLSARAKTTLTLLEAAERAAQLIEQGTYRREAPPAAFPIVEDAREEHADGTAAQAGFSEAEINAVLCHGSGFSKGKFRIAEWYEGRHTEKETADFLKHEYGVGGMTWTFPDGTHGSVDYNMYGSRTYFSFYGKRRLPISSFLF